MKLRENFFPQKLCMEKNPSIFPTNLFKGAVDFDHEEMTKNKLHRLIDSLDYQLSNDILICFIK